MAAVAGSFDLRDKRGGGSRSGPPQQMQMCEMMMGMCQQLMMGGHLPPMAEKLPNGRTLQFSSPRQRTFNPTGGPGGNGVGAAPLEDAAGAEKQIAAHPLQCNMHAREQRLKRLITKKRLNRSQKKRLNR